MSKHSQRWSPRAPPGDLIERGVYLIKSAEAETHYGEQILFSNSYPDHLKADSACFLIHPTRLNYLNCYVYPPIVLPRPFRTSRKQARERILSASLFHDRGELFTLFLRTPASLLRALFCEARGGVIAPPESVSSSFSFKRTYHLRLDEYVAAQSNS